MDRLRSHDVLFFVRTALLLCVLLLCAGSVPQMEARGFSRGFSSSDGQARDELGSGLDFSRRGPKAVWVYFKDKGRELERKMDLAAASTGFRSLERRGRHLAPSRLVDIHDIPVEPGYVESIRPFVLCIRHESRWMNAVSVEATDRGIRALASLPCVARIEPVKTVSFREPEAQIPLDGNTSGSLRSIHALDYGPSLNQSAMINVPALHDGGYTGTGILICMLDTGFDLLDHEALRHLRIVDTWDFVNGDPNVFSEAGQMGSGTHGSQTLAVLAGYSPGFLIGPAPDASFLLAKTENTEWERHIEEDHWVAGLEWAEALGADIVSSSLGYRDLFTHGEPDYDSSDMDGRTTVVTRAANIAAAKGVLIVNSAGNEGASQPPDNTLVAPSDGESVLAVGAVTPRGLRASFSSTGPTADGRIKPDVMAQGQSVVTIGTASNSSYVSADGTSFSCPLAAGTAALLLQANPDWTNLDLITALKSTAKNADRPDNRAGWGIIDALAAGLFDRQALHPPLDFKAARLENFYGFFTQYIDVLTWSPDPQSADRVAGYRLSARRADLPDAPFLPLMETDARTFRYERRGLLADEVYVYRITAFSAGGEESRPVYAETDDS